MSKIIPPKWTLHVLAKCDIKQIYLKWRMYSCHNRNYDVPTIHFKGKIFKEYNFDTKFKDITYFFNY